MKKVNFLLSIFFVTISTFIVVKEAYAEEVKIVVVDLQQVIAKSELGKSARTKLQNDMNNAKSKLSKEAQAIKAMELKVQKQASLLSKSAMAEKLEEFEEKKKDLQRKSEDEEEELKIKNSKYIREVVESARSSLSELATEKGYEFVLEKDRGFLIYSDKSIDITQELIERLNKDRLSL